MICPFCEEHKIGIVISELTYCMKCFTLYKNKSKNKWFFEIYGDNSDKVIFEITNSEEKRKNDDVPMITIDASFNDIFDKIKDRSIVDFVETCKIYM